MQSNSNFSIQSEAEGALQKGVNVSTITELDEGHSTDTDQEDSLAEKKLVEVVKLEQESQVKKQALETLEEKLKREKDVEKRKLLSEKYRSDKRSVTMIEKKLHSMMASVKDGHTSIKSDRQNHKAHWVRAIFDYKPVGKPGYIYFVYDEIIEITDDDVKVEVKKKTDKMDFASFLAGTLDDDEDEDEGPPPKIMRGFVIGSKPLREGLFPSTHVVDVNKLCSDYKRPDEKAGPKTLLGNIRGKVSKKKRRFISSGFNLDLSYITPQIIAMGIPASDMSAFYRNNLDEVTKFLNHFHKDHYQLYNLCDDRSYDVKKFNSRVVQYGFEDHNPCPFDMMEPFCQHLHSFLSESEENVGAIHCKAGKGRTGLMIASYLIYNGQHKEAEAALRYFAVKRTKNCKGVTIPSQKRYVDYFRIYVEQLRSGKLTIPRSQPLAITQLTLSPIPKHCDQGHSWFIIDQFSTLELAGANQLKKVKSTSRIDCKVGCTPPNAVLKRLVSSSKALKRVKMERIREGKAVVWNVKKDMAHVDGDVRLTFVFRARLAIKKKKLFQLWINTRFLTPNADGVAEISIPKPKIDKICKDLQHTVFPANFVIHLRFQKL